MSSHQRALVTGASGFIGRNLLLKTPDDWQVIALYHRDQTLPAFVSQNRLSHVRAIQCDLSQIEDVTRVANEIGPDFDLCFYLAANGNPATSVEDPVADLTSNTVTLLNFLQAFRLNRVIYFSSGAVYDGLKGPVSPEAKPAPTLPYAISNLASESYIGFAHHSGLVGSYLILRFFGAFGPYEPARKIYTRLVRAFYFENSDAFTIRGSGENLIDAMYVEDAILGALAAAGSTVANVTLDFYGGSPLTINELVKKAALTFGVSAVNIRHEGDVPEYIEFYPVDDSMKRLCDFDVRISLTDGLRKLARFLENGGVWV